MLNNKGFQCFQPCGEGAVTKDGTRFVPVTLYHTADKNKGIAQYAPDGELARVLVNTMYASARTAQTAAEKLAREYDSAFPTLLSR